MTTTDYGVLSKTQNTKDSHTAFRRPTNTKSNIMKAYLALCFVACLLVLHVAWSANRLHQLFGFRVEQAGELASGFDVTADPAGNLRFVPDRGFESTNGLHVPRHVVIERAKTMLWDYLEPLIRKDRPLACINLHLQSNVGDTALMKAQLKLIQDLGIPNDLLIFNTTGPANQYKKGNLDKADAKILQQISDKGGTVLFAAGGNMGTIYKINQKLYNQVIRLAPGARIIHLPQSLVVQQNQMAAFNETVGSTYRHHPDVHVFMRDVKSYHLAMSLQMAPGRTHLVPDLAFYLGRLESMVDNGLAPQQAKPTVLWMKRADGETPSQSNKNGGSYNPQDNHPDIGVVGPIDWRGSNCPKQGKLREHANTHLQDFKTKEAYYEAEMQRGTQLLAKGQAVLTDRLHGQNLSYLMGLPLVVLPDKTLKGYNFFSTWTHVSSADTKYAKSIPDAFNEAENLLMLSPSPSTPAGLPSVSNASIAGGDSKQVMEHGITLIILTIDLQRAADLERTLNTAAANPLVKQILVIWNKPGDVKNMSILEKRLTQNTDSEKLQILKGEKNSLNNRYDPNLPIETDAVMMLDDDLLITNDTISCLFESWEHDPDGLHSFGEGRRITRKKYIHQGPRPYKDSNFLLPRWMFHQKYLSIYFSSENNWLRNYVDTQGAHCDDVAFATMWTKHTKMGMTHVPAPFAKRMHSGKLKWTNDHNGEDNEKIPNLKTDSGLEKQSNRDDLRQECTVEILKKLDWRPPLVKQGNCFYAAEK